MEAAAVDGMDAVGPDGGVVAPRKAFMPADFDGVD